MNKENVKKSLIIGTIIFCIFIKWLPGENVYNIFLNIFNPIIWILLSIFCAFSSSSYRFFRIKNKEEKIFWIILLVFLYLVFYFSTGLFLGYSNNPYSRELFQIIKNIWIFAFVIFFQEYVRFVLIRLHSKITYSFIIVTTLFILVEINPVSFINNLSSFKKFFEYFLYALVPVIFNNILLTYMAYSTGYIACIIFRVPIILASLILPVQPNLNPFLKVLIELLLAALIIRKLHVIDFRRDIHSRYKRTKKNPDSFHVAWYVLCVILFLFVAGVFKYYPIGIVSNSMHPQISRGDAVILEKLSKDDLERIKTHDIIAFTNDNNITVVHRVANISYDDHGNKYYTTKGDNNSGVDQKGVYEDQVVGVVKITIPIIGYPAVWANEYFNGS